MSVTAGTVLFAMTLLIAFLYGAILWHREGQMDRIADDVESLERTVGLMLGREKNRDKYLGIEVHDPVPDGPDEYVPDPEWEPAATEQPSLEPDDDPPTDEIPVCPPTVPTEAVIADGWRDLDAMYEAAMAKIRGA